MTASVTFHPKNASASALILLRIMAETSSGVYSLSPISTATPVPFLTIWYGMISRSFWTFLVSKLTADQTLNAVNSVLWIGYADAEPLVQPSAHPFY